MAAVGRQCLLRHSHGPRSKAVRLFVKSFRSATENGTTASSTRLLLSHPCGNPNNSHRVNWLGEKYSAFRPYPHPAASPEVPEASEASAPPQGRIPLVVTPFIELTTFDLKAVSLTAKSLAAASKEGGNFLKETSECQDSMGHRDPLAEQLVSPEVDGILRNEKFGENLTLLGIDDALHTCFPGERTSERPTTKIFSFNAASLPIRHPLLSVR